MVQNQSSAMLYSLREVPMRYKRLYGKELDFYEMLELADYVMQQAGSIATKYYLLKTSIKDFEVNLPCNVYSIEYVCDANVTSWLALSGYNLVSDMLFNYRVDQSGNYGLYNPAATNVDDLGPDDSTSLYEVNKNVFDAPLGNMLNFQNDQNCCLSFNIKERDILVLYRGKVVDSEGYPMVPDKTITAIARWCILNDVKKRFYSNQSSADHLALADKDYKVAIAQARTPDSLGLNESDQLLNALTTHNRKLYNRQYRGR